MWELLFGPTVFDIGYPAFFPLLKFRCVFLKPCFKITDTGPSYYLFNSWILLCFSQGGAPTPTGPLQGNGRNILRKVFVSVFNTVQNSVQILQFGAKIVFGKSIQIRKIDWLVHCSPIV